MIPEHLCAVAARNRPDLHELGVATLIRSDLSRLVDSRAPRARRAGESRGRPNVGPAPKRDQSPGSGVRGLGDRPGPHLVEAGAAIHRPIVPGSERHHRLAPATTADRRVKLPRSAGRSGTLRDRPASRTSLWVVQ